MMKNTYYSQENLILKGKKRYSKKQIFLKKFISTLIVCSLFAILAISFAKVLITTNMQALSGTAFDAVIATDYIEKHGVASIQNLVSLSTSNEGLISFVVKVYDENNNLYIAPRDNATIIVKNFKEDGTSKFLQVSEDCFLALKPYIEKYSLNVGDINELSEPEYYYLSPTHLFVDGESCIITEANICDSDENIVEGISLGMNIPENSIEYTADDFERASVNCYTKNDNEYLSNRIDEMMRNDFSSEHGDDYSICTYKFSKDGKKYTIAEGMYVNMQKINGYIFMITIPLTLIIAAVITIFRTRSEYVTLMAHYAVEDYRKDMTNKLAHDLKTPLMAISGYAENLECNINTEKREHYAASIAENVKYMDSIITNVLELSKLDENTVRLAEISFNAANTVNEVLKNYSVQIEKNNLKVFVNGNAEFNTDKNIMHSILDNLINNAVKYTDESGNITIECSKGKITVTNDCKSAGTVDTTAIIQPFVKSDNSRSGKSGSGLGLSIASKAAERAGLKLSFNTENGKFIAAIAE